MDQQKSMRVNQNVELTRQGEINLLCSFSSEIWWSDKNESLFLLVLFHLVTPEIIDEEII